MSEQSAPRVPHGRSRRASFKPGKTGPAANDVAADDLPADRTPNRRPRRAPTITVAGRVRAIRVQPWGGNPALECTLADETGSITVVFFGRREIGGVRLGTIMSVTGVAGEHHGMRAILNPEYTDHLHAGPAGAA